MNKERLQHLVEVLEEVAKHPEPRFSLYAWFEPEMRWPFEDSERDEIESEFKQVFDAAPEFDTLFIPHKCGAVACACGYAGLDPQFRKEGFLTLPDGQIKYYLREERSYYSNWTAVKRFFGLQPYEAQYLFGSESYPFEERKNVHAVISRLKEVLDGKEIIQDFTTYWDNEEEEGE